MAHTIVKKPASVTKVKHKPSFLENLGSDIEGFAATPGAILTPGLPKKFGIEEPQETPLAKGIVKTGGNLLGDVPLVGPAAKNAVKGAAGLIEGTVKAGENVVSAGETAAKDASSISGFLGQLTEPGTWIRIGKVIAGGLMIIVGLWMFAKVIAPGASSSVSKAAGTIAPERYIAGQAARRAVSQAAPKTSARAAVYSAHRRQAKAAIRARNRGRR